MGARRHVFSPIVFVPGRNSSAPSPEMNESPNTTITCSPVVGSVMSSALLSFGDVLHTSTTTNTTAATSALVSVAMAKMMAANPIARIAR